MRPMFGEWDSGGGLAVSVGEEIGVEVCLVGLLVGVVVGFDVMVPGNDVGVGLVVVEVLVLPANCVKRDSLGVKSDGRFQAREVKLDHDFLTRLMNTHW